MHTCTHINIPHADTPQTYICLHTLAYAHTCTTETHIHSNGVRGACVQLSSLPTSLEQIPNPIFFCKSCHLQTKMAPSSTTALSSLTHGLQKHLPHPHSRTQAAPRDTVGVHWDSPLLQLIPTIPSVVLDILKPVPLTSRFIWAILPNRWVQSSSPLFFFFLNWCHLRKQNCSIGWVKLLSFGVIRC